MWKPQGIYADFMLYRPTIFFGENALRGLATFPGARIAVISSSSIDRSIKDLFITVFKKKALFFVHRSWNGEPDMESIQGSISELENIRPDVIIAIGGGSVIDGAKLCRLFYEFPYFKVGETKLTQMYFKTRFIAIPTTVGSGAEASSAAVYINKTKACKEMIVCHELQPSIVVLDPRYVSNAPEKVILLSALDATAHIIEGYTSAIDNELSELEAETSLKIFIDELPKKTRNYQRMQYAGYLSGIIQNHCLVGAAHAVAHQLSEYGYSHGEAVAFLLPNVMRINSLDETARMKLETLCKNVGFSGVDELAGFINNVIKNIGLYAKKADLYKLLVELVKNEKFIENVSSDMGGKGNPIPITRTYIERLIGDIGDEL